MSAVLTLDRIGVGIDTARYGHRVSFLRPDRSPAAPALTVMEKREGYQALEDRLRDLHRQHPQARFLVRIDAAGHYALNLEQFLRGLDLPLSISIGEPKRNKDYRTAHFPKRTTDDTESQAMARFAVVEDPAPTAGVPPQMIILREVAGRLQAQVKQTTREINRLHNLLARAFPELAAIAPNIAASWVLRLLDAYPTAQRVGNAHRASLEKIPYFPDDQLDTLHQAARNSVATMHGETAEALVRGQVRQLRRSQEAEDELRGLLETAFADVPASAHRQVQTIPGIGLATAAVLVAKIIDIDRFATPARLVGYFGIFPEEDRSGVDKQGRPLPVGSLSMCQKGNDLVRSYLWNAARVAIRHNPAITPLYKRLKAKGTRGDVVLGHCMRKLLHLVFAVWKTDRAFDPDRSAPKSPSPSEPTSSATPATCTTPAASATPAAVAASDNEKTAGHKRDKPAKKVVATAKSKVDRASPTVKPQLPIQPGTSARQGTPHSTNNKSS